MQTEQHADFPVYVFFNYSTYSRTPYSRPANPDKLSLRLMDAVFNFSVEFSSDRTYVFAMYRLKFKLDFKPCEGTYDGRRYKVEKLYGQYVFMDLHDGIWYWMYEGVEMQPLREISDQSVRARLDLEFAVNGIPERLPRQIQARHQD